MADVKKDYTRRGEEPRITEMMDDPIMKLLMKSDGVSVGALLPLIEEVGGRVRREQQPSAA